MLYYDPQHVLSSTLLILRRTNFITTASGIVTLCKQPYSMQVESGLQSALHLHTVRLCGWSAGNYCNMCTVFLLWEILNMAAYIVWIITFTIEKLKFIVLFQLSEGHKDLAVSHFLSLVCKCLFHPIYTHLFSPHNAVCKFF